LIIFLNVDKRFPEPETRDMRVTLGKNGDYSVRAVLEGMSQNLLI
jgi:hypothetical protein